MFIKQLAVKEDSINATNLMETLRASWQPALDKFKQIRKKYLLYDDF
jgi:hypothetical protein